MAEALDHQPTGPDRTAADVPLIENFGRREGPRVHFECAVEPLACEACLNGLARLPDVLPGLFDLRWSREQSTLKFHFREGSEFPQQVYDYLKSLQMAPRWKRPGDEEPQQNQHRRRVMGLGITAALAGNIMLLSFSLYAGLAGELARLFEWLQGALFLPVFFFSAAPLLRTAWVSFRLKQLSVDVPLAFAFVLGTGFSTYSLVTGGHDLYFDSLSGFLFLILWSRFVLERSLASHLKSPPLDSFVENPLFEIRRATQIMTVLWDQLRTGDEIQLKAGERLIVDARLLSASAEFDSAWITGESETHLRLRGAQIQAGTRLVSREAELIVERPALETEFAKLLNQLASNEERLRSPAEARLGVFLVLACFVAVAGLCLVAGSLGWAEVLRRSVAVLIVACPCAVSFAAPLARARAGQLAFRHGFWIRDPRAWDRLRSVRTIAFDKTGTLTGRGLELTLHSPMMDARWKQIVLSLENISRHPVADSLRRAWGSVPLLAVENAQEIVGSGVTGTIEGQRYEIRGGRSTSGRMVIELLREGNRVMELELQEQPKPRLRELLDRLGRRFRLLIISGDRPERVQKFAREYGIAEAQAWGGLSPAQKLEKIRAEKPDLYFGDGTNDLLALREAPVSVAVAGSSPEAMAAADILMLDSRLDHLENLFEISLRSQKLIRRNLGLALIYNICAGLAAILGLINPLVAALLMPLSSVLLLISTLEGGRLTPVRTAREIL